MDKHAAGVDDGRGACGHGQGQGLQHTLCLEQADASVIDLGLAKVCGGIGIDCVCGCESRCVIRPCVCGVRRLGLGACRRDGCGKMSLNGRSAEHSGIHQLKHMLCIDEVEVGYCRCGNALCNILGIDESARVALPLIPSVIGIELIVNILEVAALGGGLSLKSCFKSCELCGVGRLHLGVKSLNSGVDSVRSGLIGVVGAVGRADGGKHLGVVGVAVNKRIACAQSALIRRPFCGSVEIICALSVCIHNSAEQAGQTEIVINHELVVSRLGESAAACVLGADLKLNAEVINAVGLRIIGVTVKHIGVDRAVSVHGERSRVKADNVAALGIICRKLGGHGAGHYRPADILRCVAEQAAVIGRHYREHRRVIDIGHVEVGREAVHADLVCFAGG